MFHLKHALSAEFLKELAVSTAEGLAKRDCFYDQFHYVNRRFISKHFEELAGLVVNALTGVYPGITTRDIVYVNDFVAPVNLINAQVHTGRKDNKYGWHTDGIDSALRPCFNLWIPLYQQSALAKLDDQSLFDVLTAGSCSGLYDAQGNLKCETAFWDVVPALINDTEITAKLVRIPANKLRDYTYFHNGHSIEKIPVAEVTPISVIRPALGDCYVFDSSNLHSSGPSSFERIGISIKFLVKNPELGFRVLPHFVKPYGWLGMFMCWYDQYRTFGAYEDVVDMYIMRENALLERNADKVECVRNVLLNVSNELCVEQGKMA